MGNESAVLVLLFCIIVYYFKAMYQSVSVLFMLYYYYYSIASCEALRTCMDLHHTNTILTDRLIYLIRIVIPNLLFFLCK